MTEIWWFFGREEKLAGSARDGVAEMFDVFAETASGVTAREQRAGKQNKNDKAFHHLWPE